MNAPYLELTSLGDGVVLDIIFHLNYVYCYFIQYY